MQWKVYLIKSKNLTLINKSFSLHRWVSHIPDFPPLSGLYYLKNGRSVRKVSQLNLVRNCNKFN